MPYEQAKVIVTQENQQLLTTVSSRAKAETATILRESRRLERQAFGGFVRQTLPPLVDKWGAVNGRAALAHYEQLQDIYRQRQEIVMGSAIRSRRQAQARARRSFARRGLQGRIYVAKMPRFNPVEIADPIVNGTLATFASKGFDAASIEAQNAVTRAVGSYNRDTMLFNAGLDENVAGVQRVAEPTACQFCVTMAFDSVRAVRTSPYAVSWHNNCQCSIEVLYPGEAPIRPDYYNDFEREFDEYELAPPGDERFDAIRAPRDDAETNLRLRTLIAEQRAISGRK